MTEDIDLKKLEKKTVATMFQDGLLDILLGFIFLATVLLILFYDILPLPLNVIIPEAVCCTIGFTIFFAGKKYITTPRMGIVKLKAETRNTLRKKMLIILPISVLITALTLIFTLISFLFSPQPLKLSGLIVPYLFLGMGLLAITLPLGLTIYLLKFPPRGYIIAVLGGMSIFLAEVLHPFVGSPLNSLLVFGSIVGIIFSLGFVSFVRFLRDYPFPNEEVMADKEDSS